LRYLDCFFPALPAHQQTARTMLMQDASPAVLPDDAFVFHLRPGDHFVFFRTSEGDDPPVYAHKRDWRVKPMPMIFYHFSHFLAVQIALYTMYQLQESMLNPVMRNKFPGCFQAIQEQVRDLLYGEMLHFHLFYTLCTEALASSWAGERPVLYGDEPVIDWIGYTGRDEEIRALWGMFKGAVPEALAPYYQSRALPISRLSRESIIGILTPQETQYFLEHVRTYERPWLKTILGGCIRDGVGQEWSVDPQLPLRDRGLFTDSLEVDAPSWEYRLSHWMYKDYEGKYADFQTVVDYWFQEHPEEMQKFQERYYQDLWQVEAEVLRRMKLAVARGWGMLQTDYE
jgi:hypothetical protein